MKQTTFASRAYAGKKKRTRREKLLAEMEAVVPRARLTALIEPHYPKAGPKGGRPERHELTRAIFEAVNAYLRERGILLREGTLVDATLIGAPSSTKNKQGDATRR